MRARSHVTADEGSKTREGRRLRRGMEEPTLQIYNLSQEVGKRKIEETP